MRLRSQEAGPGQFELLRPDLRAARAAAGQAQGQRRHASLRSAGARRERGQRIWHRARARCAGRHDPSANSDLDRIVVELLARWMGDCRGVWEAEPASFSINVGMGTIADPKFISYVAGLLKNQKIPAKALGFEISEKSCVEQPREVEAVRPGLRKTRLSRGARRLHLPSQRDAVVRLAGPQVPQARRQDHRRGDEGTRAAGAGRGHRPGLQGARASPASPSVWIRRRSATGSRPWDSTTPRVSCSISRSRCCASAATAK